MRISNKVGGKEGRDDEGQTVHICELCSNSVTPHQLVSFFTGLM